jgi:iron(III) transport system permease protein
MPSRQNWPALLLALPLFAYIVYPLGAMLSESLTLPIAEYRARHMGWDPAAQPIGAPLRGLVAEPAAREAVWGTLKLSICTVVCGGAWGLALVLLWYRREFPGRRFFALLGYAPLVMPPLVGTLAFFRFIGQAGWLWRALPFGSGEPWLGGFGQVLLLHTYSFGLYSYAYVAAALEDSDASREEAAQNLGAGWLRTFFAAVWPVIKPALMASALLTFMAAAASFSAPYVLDNSSNYLTVEIVNRDDDPGLQRALSVVLALLSLAALPAFLYVNRQRYIVADVALGVKGAARRQLPPASSLGKTVRFILSLIATVILLAPPATVVQNALSPGNGNPGGLDGLLATLNGERLASLWRSAGYGAVAAVLDIALAVAAALALRRARYFAALPVEFAVMLAVALPGSVIGIALLSAFNAPSALAFGLPLGGTAAILILAYIVRDLPLAVRPARAALNAVGGDVENAAASLGAGRTRVLLRVILPLMFPSLLAAGLICFITGMGEFVASQLLYAPRTRPVSVLIAEIFRTDPAPAFALALCLMLFTLVTVGLAGWVQKRARQ